MPIIKSAKKRVRVAKRQSIENSKTKKQLRVSLKKFQAALMSGKKIEESQNEAQSALDTAVKKGIISKNKAARKKSQINSAAKDKNGGKRAKTVKKTTTKKPVAKKTKK